RPPASPGNAARRASPQRVGCALDLQLPGAAGKPCSRHASAARYLLGLVASSARRNAARARGAPGLGGAQRGRLGRAEPLRPHPCDRAQRRSLVRTRHISRRLWLDPQRPGRHRGWRTKRQCSSARACPRGRSAPLPRRLRAQRRRSVGRRQWHRSQVGGPPSPRGARLRAGKTNARPLAASHTRSEQPTRCDPMMAGLLADILAEKRRWLGELRVPRSSELPSLRPVRLRRPAGAPLRLITEIKRRSPSAGALSTKLGVAERAAAYERAGACMVSVLCDTPYFDGGYDHLSLARAACSLPLLCKDFIIDERQLELARAHGADAALLIVRCLSRERLIDLMRTARSLELVPFVE